MMLFLLCAVSVFVGCHAACIIANGDCKVLSEFEHCASHRPFGLAITYGVCDTGLKCVNMAHGISECRSVKRESSDISDPIVCIPQLCDNVKQPELHCKGSVVKHGGFCGCTNVCAQVEGESCQSNMPFGFIRTLGPCDTGLHCQSKANILFSGVCVKD